MGVYGFIAAFAEFVKQKNTGTPWRLHVASCVWRLTSFERSMAAHNGLVSSSSRSSPELRSNDDRGYASTWRIRGLPKGALARRFGPSDKKRTHLTADPFSSVDLTEHYGNRRQQVERLASAWNHGSAMGAMPAGEQHDPLIGASVEPRRRPRTQLTTHEVNAMRTARANGVSATMLAKQYGIHRGTVWAKTREV